MTSRLIVCPSCANLAKPSESHCLTCGARLRLPAGWTGPIAPAAMVLMGLAAASCTENVTGGSLDGSDGFDSSGGIDGSGGLGGAGGIVTTSDTTVSVVAGYTSAVSVGGGFGGSLGGGGEGAAAGADGAGGTGGAAGTGGAGGTGGAAGTAGGGS
ncbi:hypothetical protein WME75_33190 [Sorangium sp. So ce1014]|uniref:hypothetical protein n=1 Tax=Sorangium sp. So ce1014 TaxID=3133326 RepID=UPI003F61CFE3